MKADCVASCARCGLRSWRVAAEWWSESGCTRDYYDLELSDGGVYRCYRDGASEQWFVDGVYD